MSMSIFLVTYLGFCFHRVWQGYRQSQLPLKEEVITYSSQERGCARHSGPHGRFQGWSTGRRNGQAQPGAFIVVSWERKARQGKRDHFRLPSLNSFSGFRLHDSPCCPVPGPGVAEAQGNVDSRVKFHRGGGWGYGLGVERCAPQGLSRIIQPWKWHASLVTQW